MGRIGREERIALETRTFWGDRLLESKLELVERAIVRAPPGLVVEVRRGEEERWRGPVAELGPGAVARIEDGALVHEYRRVVPPASADGGLASDFDLGLARRLAIAALAMVAVIAASFVVPLDDPGLVERTLPMKWLPVIPRPPPKLPPVLVIHDPTPPDFHPAEPHFAVTRPEHRRDRDEQLVGDTGVLRLLRELGGGGDVFAASVGGGVGANEAVNDLRTGGDGPGEVHGVAGLGPRGGPGGVPGPLSIGVPLTIGNGRPGGMELGRAGRHDAVRVNPGKVTVVGGLSKDVIGKAIRAKERQVVGCYERELQKDPNLEGKLAVSFVIDGTGGVAEVIVVEDTLGNPSVAGCVRARIREWRFPAPDGGGQVIVHYPWIFRAAGAE